LAGVDSLALEYRLANELDGIDPSGWMPTGMLSAVAWYNPDRGEPGPEKRPAPESRRLRQRKARE
jgi:hypothetical protein